MTRKRSLFLALGGVALLVALLLPYLFTNSGTSGETYEDSDFVLGTIVKIKLYDAPSRGLFDSIFEKIREYESLLSLNMADSEISKINEAAGLAPVKIQPTTMDVIRKGLHFSQISGGRFDISVGPLVNLWRIGYDDARIPSDEEIKDVLPLVDYRHVLVTDDSIMLNTAGMALDLGAIAKGYIADKIAELLREKGYERGIINLGGNVLALGEKPEGEPYRIGIQNPWELRGQSVGILELRNMSLVSSGDYERYFEENGVRYHHILDRYTGYPADTGLSSVTIISPRSVDGDGLSTSIFAMGLPQGYRLIMSLKEIEAIFITSDRKIVMTPGAKALFTPLNKDFEVIPIDSL